MQSQAPKARGVHRDMPCDTGLAAESASGEAFPLSQISCLPECEPGAGAQSVAEGISGGKMIYSSKLSAETLERGVRRACPATQA